MQFKLLPETESLVEVLLRPTFVFSYVAMAGVLLSITYFMERTQKEDASAPTFLVHSTTYFDVISFTVLTSVTVFVNSQQITRAIAIGQSPRISLKRLQSLPWPLNIICGSYGDRKLIPFVLELLSLVGVLATAAMYGLSWYVNGPDRLTEWRMPLHRYLASSMLWRLLVGTAVFVLNYLAAHNPTQSVLIPSEDADASAAETNSIGAGNRRQ